MSIKLYVVAKGLAKSSAKGHFVTTGGKQVYCFDDENNNS